MTPLRGTHAESSLRLLIIDAKDQVISNILFSFRPVVGYRLHCAVQIFHDILLSGYVRPLSAAGSNYKRIESRSL